MFNWTVYDKRVAAKGELVIKLSAHARLREHSLSKPLDCHKVYSIVLPISLQYRTWYAPPQAIVHIFQYAPSKCTSINNNFHEPIQRATNWEGIAIYILSRTLKLCQVKVWTSATLLNKPARAWDADINTDSSLTRFNSSSS